MKPYDRYGAILIALRKLHSHHMFCFCVCKTLDNKDKINTRITYDVPFDYLFAFVFCLRCESKQRKPERCKPKSNMISGAEETP